MFRVVQNLAIDILKWRNAGIRRNIESLDTLMQTVDADGQRQFRVTNQSPTKKPLMKDFNGKNSGPRSRQPSFNCLKNKGRQSKYVAVTTLP